MKITIGKYSKTINDDEFSKILSIAAVDLEKLKRFEGKSFPASDEAALKSIRELQWILSEKIIGRIEDIG